MGSSICVFDIHFCYTLAKSLRYHKQSLRSPLVFEPIGFLLSKHTMKRKRCGFEDAPIAKKRKAVDQEARLAAQKHAIDTLSASQKRVLEAMLEGESLFFTGAAGTGKSYLLKTAVPVLQDKYGEDAVYVTASTGIAACNVGGTTVHSFAGIGLGDDSAANLIDKINNPRLPAMRKARARWVAAKVLIIEECSMIQPDLFEKLDRIARSIRGVFNRPFGGIQIVLCGDFYQLPPVVTDVAAAASAKTMIITEQGTMEKKEPLDFIFETKVWQDMIGDHVYLLTDVFRQKEPEFLHMLEDFRRGEIDEQSRALFDERRRVTEMLATLPEDTVKLFATRKDAEIVNEYNLSKLTGGTHVFEAIDKGEPNVVQKMLNHWMAPQRLTLKMGASVMYIFNVDIETGIVNGLTGKVIAFMDEAGGLPVVEYTLPNGVKARDTVKPVTWDIKSGHAVIASRTQIPLILSYAITIHKSQGLSLRRLEVNTRKLFEHGQLYTALSRGTNLDGLYIRGEMPRASLLVPNPKVVQWWNTNVA